LVLLGHVDAALRRSGQLASFGGHIPDAMPRELLTLVPLAVLAVLLGLWPGPLLSSIAVASRDASVVVDPEGPDPMADGR
jgi:NADH:ubiquinone oxidoreductase subunit 4 (subunit M)